MANTPLPTPELLRQLLRYEPETGRLFWKARTPDMFKDGVRHTASHICARWNSEYAGREAFTYANRKGYKTGAIFTVWYRAHRIIWKMVTGQEPAAEIDHINRDQSDNRFSNLREASRSQNNRNVTPARRGTSQYLGVHRDRITGKWIAGIRVGGKNKHLGVYQAERDAAIAYDTAAASAFGEFASLNFSEVLSEARSLS